MNSCTFAGRVGSVQELKYHGDDAVFSFSLAVDRGKDKSGEKRPPLWVKVSLWKEQAEALSKYITVGGSIAATGQVDLRSYETNNETRTELTLLFPRVTLLGGGTGAENPTKPARKAKQISDEDIPF